MRDEGTRTVTAGKAGTAMETTKLGAFAHGDKTGTRDPQESHRDLRETATPGDGARVCGEALGEAHVLAEEGERRECREQHQQRANSLLSCGADSHACPGGAGDAGLCTWERTSTKNAHVTVPNRVLLEPPYLPSGASG